MTEQQTLLSHGVATAYVESGVLRIQRDVTTYRKNAYGVADNSYLDSETLHTSAYVLRKLKSVITSKYGRHKLASDGTRFWFRSGDCHPGGDQRGTAGNLPSA